MRATAAAQSDVAKECLHQLLSAVCWQHAEETFSLGDGDGDGSPSGDGGTRESRRPANGREVTMTATPRQTTCTTMTDHWPARQQDR